MKDVPAHLGGAKSATNITVIYQRNTANHNGPLPSGRPIRTHLPDSRPSPELHSRSNRYALYALIQAIVQRRNGTEQQALQHFPSHRQAFGWLSFVCCLSVYQDHHTQRGEKGCGRQNRSDAREKSRKGARAGNPCRRAGRWVACVQVACRRAALQACQQPRLSLSMACMRRAHLRVGQRER